MEKKYNLQGEEAKKNLLKEPAVEYHTHTASHQLPVHSLEEIREKLVRSEEDLAKGIYITHEEMKKRHL